MFDKLLGLYRKHRNKTPIEDFTSELLVGILNSDEKLKNKFLKDFLGLESETFRIVSQKKFFLEWDQNCIVDIVVEGNREICFIENKVHSKEGSRQLERYSKVLGKKKREGFRTKLIYCTKNPEPKKIKAHEFSQIRWIDVAKFFKKYSDRTLARLFVSYLNSSGMSEDMTIYSKDLIAIENFSRVLNLVYQHIENSKEAFYDIFGKENVKDHKAKLKSQIFDFNRVVTIKSPIIDSEKYSELLFGFELDGNLVVQLYAERNHRNFEDFNRIEEHFPDDFSLGSNEYGISFRSTSHLGRFINDENSDENIRSWFVEQFETMKTAMEKSQEIISWKI